MRPDNSAAIIAAARQRHELTRSKAIRALRELQAAAEPVTFDGVARAAGISRSWLYTQPDIRAEIEHLRQATRRAPGPAIPPGQRASSASLHARLQTAIERNRMLTEENQRLRRQLAQALGQQRSSPRASQHTPSGTSPSGNDPSPPAQPQQGRAATTTTLSLTQTCRSTP
jgi:Family of unknown function (DUF6262)